MSEADLEQHYQALHGQVQEIKAEVARLAPADVEQAIESLRGELCRRWPTLAPVLQKVETEGQPVSGYVELDLERAAYLGFVRFRALVRRRSALRDGS